MSSLEEVVSGSPKPVANDEGFAKPARPKMVISAVPTRMARHSAGGGRLAKKSRFVRLAMVGRVCTLVPRYACSVRFVERGVQCDC